jgi:RNA polymerase sigma factor (sigma-70 family)
MVELRRRGGVPMGDAASLISARVHLPPVRSKRVLALAGDEKLVEQIRRGNEAAFEVAFERYGAGILGFCRHMLGSREEAEDAVQHTFAAAFRDLQRDGDRQLALRPWLYAIARNRCVSVLRARRELATEQPEPVTAGLAEQVERRAELRDLLRDIRELSEDQRAALLLSEAGDLSHAEIANVLGCGEARVKALVFRARSGLIQRRAARETPCEEIRAELANLRGGSLRRGRLRHHLRECAGCRAYREQVRQQRRMLAAALPVAPSLGLKSSVLAAVGLGGGSAGGGLAAGLGGAATGSFGSATLAKVALVGVLAGGGAVAGKTAIDVVRQPERPQAAPGADPPAASPAAASPATAPGAGSPATAPAAERPGAGAEPIERSAPPQRRAGAGAGRRERLESGAPGVRKRGERAAGGLTVPRNSSPHSRAPGWTKRGTVPPGHLPRDGPPRGGPGNGLAHGHSKPAAKAERAPRGNGRGPIEAPPARTPVKRGPPEPKPAADRSAKLKVTPKTPSPAAEPKPAAEALPADKAPKAPNDHGSTTDSALGN